MHICEVQLVHSQLYTVRKNMGAHKTYSVFRAALELLEREVLALWGRLADAEARLESSMHVAALMGRVSDRSRPRSRPFCLSGSQGSAPLASTRRENARCVANRTAVPCKTRCGDTQPHKKGCSI